MQQYLNIHISTSWILGVSFLFKNLNLALFSRIKWKISWREYFFEKQNTGITRWWWNSHFAIFLKNIKFLFDWAETWTFNHFQFPFIHFSSNICQDHMGFCVEVLIGRWVLDKDDGEVESSLMPGSSYDLCYLTNEQPEQRFLSAVFRSHGWKIKANWK